MNESSAPAEAHGSKREVVDGDFLWLWKNGDHYLAFRHEYPCFEPGGDPMTLGQPFGRAIFTRSYDRASRAPAARSNVQPKGTVNEAALVDLINSHLTGFYWCGRVWEAWNVGTMGEDDFTPADETEFASGLAADVLKLLGTAAQAPAPAHELTDDQIDTLLGDHDAALNNEQRKAVHAAIRAALAAFRAPAVGAEPVRYPHPDEDDPVTLWKEIRRLRAAMSQAKCDCTAYCGQYVLHGSCRAHPAPVTISHVPVQGSQP